MPVLERVADTLSGDRHAWVWKGCSHTGMQGVDDAIGTLSDGCGMTIADAIDIIPLFLSY